MFALRSDLPLRGTSAGFVRGLVMVLVFMAAFAVTVDFYIGALLNNWSRNVTGTLTVQIPTSEGGDANVSAQVVRVMDVLSRHPDVAKVQAVPRAKVIELLKPWLGEGPAVNDLPLPALIDVELKAGSRDAAAAVSAVTKAAAPGAVIDDHRVWLNRVVGLAEGIGTVAFVVMLLVTGALSLTIVFATRASITEFAQVIEVLHVVGAKDGYIAGQFARRALNQSFSGGVAGLALYAPALGLVGWLAGRVDPEILPQISLPPVHWLTLVLLPVVAAILALTTANITVRRMLATKV